MKLSLAARRTPAEEKREVFDGGRGWWQLEWW